MPKEKEYYSVIPDPQRRKGGKLLRHATNRKEMFVPTSELKTFFIEETSRLYYWNFDNPHQEEIEALSEELEQMMGQIMATFLLLRRDQENTSLLLRFGHQVSEYSEKTGMSPIEFQKEFRRRYKLLFGELPSYDGMLTFKG